jgi:hypothetical protein
MSHRRSGFTTRRRRSLARRFALERAEPRSTVTPVGLAAFAIGTVPVAAQLGVMDATGGG